MSLIFARAASSALALSCVLAACGGGGGGDAPSLNMASTLSFPLQSAYKAYIANGSNRNFTVSGSCSGSGSLSMTPASTAAVFEGQAALAAVSTLSLALTNCAPAALAQSATEYYDANYVPVGSSGSGQGYGVFAVAPLIPAAVSVGNAGSIGSESLYADSTKQVSDGRDDIGYVIEADTPSTAIVNMISRSYDAANVLISTEQDRYRIAANGALTPVSIDIQTFNGSGTHLVLSF